MHVDDELQVDEVLKVPHPFTTEVTNLKSQIETLSAQQQAAEQKSDSAQEQVNDSRRRCRIDQPEPGFGQWRQAVAVVARTAISLAIFALIMFGVMLLTMFEWWRMRRRFLALAAMTDALSRLDYKYKAMFAKAELRLQQLYGRRRGAVAEAQPRPRLPEEVENRTAQRRAQADSRDAPAADGCEAARLAAQGMARAIWRHRRRRDRRSTRLSTLTGTWEVLHHEKIRTDGYPRDRDGHAVRNGLGQRHAHVRHARMLREKMMMGLQSRTAYRALRRRTWASARLVAAP